MIYYTRNRQRIGPIPREALAQLLESSALQTTDMVIEIREEMINGGMTTRYYYVAAGAAAQGRSERQPGIQPVTPARPSRN